MTATPREQGQRYRIRVASIRYRGESCILVLGESLQPVEDAVWRLLVLLLIAGPSTLGLTALAGYWLAYKALRPVERMTNDAQEIGIARLHERVAVPTSRDEIYLLAVTLNAMLERIEVGLKEKHQLLADASHELRTPLAVMRSEIDVSLKADELSPAGRDVLASVRDEVDRMTRTIDNLMALAQADEGRLELLTVRIDLRRLVEDTVAALRPLATVKGVSLTVAGDSWEIQADPQRLRLVLINLIENAVKFSPADETVRINTWRRDGEVGVTVADNGPGVPSADREHLFDRFYRVSGPHLPESGGSGGLGLAICREVAVAHGGRIWVDSAPGGGSAFTLALPSWRSLQEDRAPAADGDDHPASPSRDATTGSQPIPPHTEPGVGALDCVSGAPTHPVPRPWRWRSLTYRVLTTPVRSENVQSRSRCHAAAPRATASAAAAGTSSRVALRRCRAAACGRLRARVHEPSVTSGPSSRRPGGSRFRSAAPTRPSPAR